MKSPTTSIRDLVLLSILLLTLSPVLTAYSQSTPPSSPPPTSVENRSIAFYPEETGPGTFITITIEPGKSTDFNVVLGNSGSLEQEIKTYAVPATSASNGGFAMEVHGTEKDDQTSWVDYPEQDFILEPGAGMIVAVSVTVPKGTSPGEYVTALAAQQAEPFAVEGSSTFNQIVRWSLPVLIIVPGDMASGFSIPNINLESRDNLLVAEVTINNEGSVTIRPTGSLTLLDESGTIIGVSQVELGSIYSGTSSLFYTSWENVPASSSYGIEFSLSDERVDTPVSGSFSDLPVVGSESEGGDLLQVTQSELTPLTDDVPPSMLTFNGLISNNGEPIENARVSIVTYKDGEEVDRYPIMQAVTIEQGTTPVEARYSLPGGFTDGTYTFEVNIEIGDTGTQTVLVTQPIDYEVNVGD